MAPPAKGHLVLVAIPTLTLAKVAAASVPIRALTSQQQQRAAQTFISSIDHSPSEVPGVWPSSEGVVAGSSVQLQWVRLCRAHTLPAAGKTLKIACRLLPTV